MSTEPKASNEQKCTCGQPDYKGSVHRRNGLPCYAGKVKPKSKRKARK